MEVWEQHEGEPDEAYVRFCYYLYLGPTRTMEGTYYLYVQSGEIQSEEMGLKKAEKSGKRPKVPGSWWQESVTYKWRFRASRWDIHNLTAHGKASLTSFYQLISEITHQHLETVREGKLVPHSYLEMMEGLQILGQYNSAEAAAAWALDGGDKPEAIPEQPGNVSSIDSKRGQKRA